MDFLAGIDGIRTKLDAAATFVANGPSAKVKRSFNVIYNDGTANRNARMFDVELTDADSRTWRLQIGQEAKNKGSENETDWIFHSNPKRGHHRIQKRGNTDCWHVLYQI